MKKIWWCLLLLWGSFLVKAQKPDSSYKQQILKKTEIEISFSYYNQNGNHSAITGGIGTEKLLVYAPNLKINHAFNNNHSFSLSTGADIITSASTDNIDFVKSSASLHDARSYLNAGYSYKLKKTVLILNAGSGFSIESDYFSVPVNIGMEFTEPSGMRSYQFSIQAYFDDLRWGRLNPDYFRPVKLIYPAELRYKEWYETYKRTSYNFKLGFTQVLNARTILGFFPEFAIQYGLLATPYQRVYFNDDSLRVEKLPDNRIKFPLGIQVNHFTGGRIIIKGYYHFYYDTFGVLSNALKLETVIKITPVLSFIPMYRFSLQSGSDYFSPYKEYYPAEIYYTSDFDLSSFNTHEAGLLLIYSPEKYINKSSRINQVNLQYNYFRRTDGLNAHNITFWMTLGVEKRKKIQIK